MSGKIFTRPAADEDLIHSYVSMADTDPERADRFLDAARDAFTTLARMPQMGSPRQFASPELAGVRMWRVPGFERYLIFYRPVEGGIEVLRVLHSSRDVATILEDEPPPSDDEV